MDSETVIIGAGLAGLACALQMHAQDRPFVLLEASDRSGGRVRTNIVSTPEGDYLVDRGFQVLLTAYPHAAKFFQYDDLDLRGFYPGAMVFHQGKFHRVADPRRRPGDAVRGFRSPIATTRDKLRLAEMTMRVLGGPIENIWQRPDKPAIDALRDAGFAQTTIDRFFRPFFGGVFFDPELSTSSRMLEFCFRIFAQGRTCVPARGMGQLAAHLQARLPADRVRTSTRVQRIDKAGDLWNVHTPDQSLACRNVVIATEGDQAVALAAPHARLSLPAVRWRTTATIAYACDRAPTDEPILVLDGDGNGPVNHLACMSAASPHYAPAGKHLVYANIIDPAVLAAHPDDAALDKACRPQLTAWFGQEVQRWNAINVDRIDHALPNQSPPWLSEPRREVQLAEGLFACGDWLDNASIDGALESGSRCAAAVLQHTLR